MITINELKPIKLSGLSSFLVKFQYDANIVAEIKQISGAIYHKKLQAWELPQYSLSDLLDSLCKYDNIDLQLLDEDEASEILDSSLETSEISSFRQKPFSHQVDAINYGLSHKKWLLLDGMGLGKTLEGIYLAESLYNRGLIKHCLVICGVDSLRQNWKAEIQKFSKLSVRVLGEQLTKKGSVKYATLAERAKELEKGVEEFFTVVNITNIRDDRFIAAFKKLKDYYGLILFDEAHRASKKSTQGNNLLQLDSEYKVAMTGTPIVNSPISAYLMLSWTDNDHATLTNFKSQYCNFGGFGGKQIVGYKNLEYLKEEIDHCSLRRTFSQVRGDMPKKTIDYELVEMSDQHSKFYEAIKAGVKEEADKIELNSSNLLALMTRLRQATVCPKILTSNQISSSKLERAAELAEDLLESGEKVLIMSNFREPAYELAEMLEEFHPLVCTGDQNEDSCTKNIQHFRNDPNFNLLIGTHGKLGTGFSMPECHYMIIIDTPYTAAMLNQSIDRIYRITSDQPVYIKILVCKDTVDERVREIVETKQDLSDYMIDGKDNSKFTDAIRGIIKNL